MTNHDLLVLGMATLWIATNWLGATLTIGRIYRRRKDVEWTYDKLTLVTPKSAISVAHQRNTKFPGGQDFSMQIPWDQREVLQSLLSILVATISASLGVTFNMSSIVFAGHYIIS